ncbi:hypothetical protein [Aureliella helgolandensis]|uniref:Uncharacterized protein n=1 Tax=Aureliella helgolandensis TaxID=2527968 RepID=A0A518GG57_9BACT|nr:hypothetical protein [Aureliella helgolandensis]QDV27586.1 hypothetical protein Q31a_59780 [Aureliella helgolandensis]
MNRPLQALLWELWRTSRKELLLVLVSQCLFVLLLYVATNYSQALTGKAIDESAAPVFSGIFVLVASVVACFSQSGRNSFDNRYSGFVFRIGFIRPITTLQLVTVPMLFVILVAPVCYLVPAVLYQACMAYSVPLLVPSLLSACVTSWLVATAWIPTTIVGRVLGLVLFAAVFVGLLIGFHSWRQHPEPLLMAIGRSDYFQLNGYQYAVLLAIPCLAIFTTYRSVVCQRCGESWWVLEAFPKWWNSGGARLKTFKPRTSLATIVVQPFASAQQAHLWFEMRRFGFHVLGLAFLLPVVPLLVTLTTTFVKPNWDREIWIWGVAIFFCPVVYQLAATEGAIGLRAKQGTLQFSTFEATRPIRNDVLIAGKLFLVAACALAGWLWMGIVAAVSAVLLGDVAHGLEFVKWLTLQVGELPWYWWSGGVLVLGMQYVGISAMLLAAGLWMHRHPLLAVYSMGIFCLHLPLVVWDATHAWMLTPLWLIYAWGASLAITLVGGWGPRRAVSSGSIGWSVLAAIGGLWLAYATLMVWVVSQVELPLGGPLAVRTLAVVSLLLPLISACLAPLALASHRHG